MMKRFIRFAVPTVLTTLALTACFEEETVSIGYLGVNHTDMPIDSVIINGEGGILNVSAQGGGGEVCCITLPKKWRPKLLTTVKWLSGGHYERDDRGQYVFTAGGDKVFVEGIWKTKTVEVPEYTQHDLAHFDIHFFTDDEVQVKASFSYPHHPDYRPAYPIKNPTKP